MRTPARGPRRWRGAAPLAAAVAGLWAAPTWGDGGAAEDLARQRAMVDAINRDPGILWQAGLGPRVALRDGEQPRARGVRPGYGKHLAELASQGMLRTVSAADLQRAPVAGGPTRPGDAAAAAAGFDERGSWRPPHAAGAMRPDPLPAASPRRPIGGPVQRARLETLPTDFDAAAEWPSCRRVINNVLDQSNCGCCWAFSVAEAAADRLCIATQGRVAVPLSTEHLCFCASRDGCDGGWPAQAWLWLRAHGIATGQQQRFDRQLPGWDPDPFANGSFCSPFSLPHCHHHGPVRSDPFPAENTLGCPEVLPGQSPQCPAGCVGSARSPHSVLQQDLYSFRGEVERYTDHDAIAHAITQCGPVSATIEAFDDFEHYVSGIYHRTPNATSRGGHAVKITGFGVDRGVKYWKVANSWNPHWGEQGFVRILRGVNEVSIESEVVAPSCGVTWTTSSPSTWH